MLRIFGRFLLVLHLPLVMATLNEKYNKLLPNHYSPPYNQDVIRNLSSRICLQESHVIRIIVNDGAIIPLTAQHILHDLNANCLAAPVEVMLDSVFQLRSQEQYPFQLCVFVFVLSDWRQFRSEWFNRRLEAKGLQRYVFVIEEMVEASEEQTDWLHNIMAELWMKQILNVVVIFSNKGEKLRWFSYTPFGKWNPQIELIEMNSTSDWFFDKLRDVGKRKLTITMRADEVRAVAKKNFETEGFSGVDGMVADLIRERMNATFVYAYATIEFNGSSSTGTLGDLRFGRANFGFNAETYVREFHEDVIEATNSFDRHDICVLVPNAAQEPTLYNLWHTLEPATWGIIITSITMMVTAYSWLQSLQIRLLGRANTERHNYNVFNTISIHFQSFLGDTISSLPTSTALRIIIFCWCEFSFLISAAFTAKLISSLVLPRHVAELDTLKDLGDSPLNVIYPNFVNVTIFQYLEEDDDSSLFTSFRDQMRPVPVERFYAMINEDRKSNAYIVPKYAAKFFRKKYFDPTTSRSSYHLMQECLLYSPKIFPIEQGSAFLVRINELLGGLNEMGFIVKWERDTIHRYTLDGQISVGDEEVADDDNYDDDDELMADGEEPKVVITVAHLQMAFYLLGLGLALSGLALAGEFWWASRERKRSLYRVVYFDRELARRHGCNVD